MPDHYRNKANGFESSLALVGEPPKTITGSSPVSEDRPNGEDLPLSLVVRREIGESSDSGQEEPDITIAKVTPPEAAWRKDFAKLLCEKESNSSSCSGSSVSGGHPCDFCDKVFINKYHLQSHVVTHTGERSFECRKCAKSFGRKSTLRAHMTTHTKVSNFMCPLCDKACNDNNSLEEHIRMHTGEKPFVCSICSKSYARKSHLNVHYRVHTGERPFVCLNCRKDFTEKRFLNDHIQTAHSGQDGPLKCPNCFREFAYKTSLKQHLKKQMCVKNLNRSGNSGGSGGNQNGCSSGGSGNNNGGGANTNFPPNVSNNTTPHSKQFSCPFCEKSYSWKQTLKQHVSMYHRNKVHTDEFWKYELTKHRRAVVDSKTNEDMWKKQLGKHGCEQNSSGELWLDQIQVIQPNQSSSQGSSPSKSSISAEMKLLALQSLQSSLKLMKMQEETPSVAAPTEMEGISPDIYPY
ncbi:Oocyte zinc finger protein XlCOF22like [Caligus rogercresseyi]|uniref:Oocyte zinc finger protein XlCOF22like n=1 Tax=Caligus rogercresseyi TaxID=217165 RepID=A0A7T8JSH4_CALRO|nr:Oocyte zinc finger protein XlCOF22like [Caligus rogercresseyi]